MKNKILIFGASGYIGQIICKLAVSNGIHTINIGRSNANYIDTFIKCDYSDYASLSDAVEIVGLGELQSIIFCQRGRFKDAKLQESKLYQPLVAELNPYLTVKNLITKNNIGRSEPLNIVSITSNAASRPAYDIDYEYEILKSAQKMAGIALGFIKSDFPIYSNVISFGEILNKNINKHTRWHEELFRLIKLTSGGKKVVDSDAVASLALLLCSASEMGLNGETLHADHGLGRISNESLLRQINNEPK